ncbi:MAG: hypothetical protein QME94_05025, partial [Anaerolineae bacterium]|nr:hypothetical protein [Anaerolineae bacterium]
MVHKPAVLEAALAGQEAERKRASLQHAAEVLNRQAEAITDRWVGNLLASLYRGRTDLRLEELR